MTDERLDAAITLILPRPPQHVLDRLPVPPPAPRRAHPARVERLRAMRHPVGPSRLGSRRIRGPFACDDRLAARTRRVNSLAILDGSIAIFDGVARHFWGACMAYAILLLILSRR
jgi:hypothetical protein